MRIAVVTPYRDEPADWLARCRASVAAQSHACTHYLVADGQPRAEAADWPVRHIVLPQGHGDMGDTPRAVGAMAAIGAGFDGVAFLDADNWWAADHIASLLALAARTGAVFLTSGRFLCHLDGTPFALCLSSDGERFADTSTMLFLRGAFGMLPAWSLMPAYAHALGGDRVILHAVRQAGLARANSMRATLFYRVKDAGLYAILGLPAPPAAAEGGRSAEAREAMTRKRREALRRWLADGHPPLAFRYRCRPLTPADQAALAAAGAGS